MQDNVFIDTNIWLYQILQSEDSDHQRKRLTALEVCQNQDTTIFISTQVLNEISNVLLKKFFFQREAVLDFLELVLDVAEVIPLDASMTIDGVEVACRYRFSLYDSLIVVAALNSGCSQLLTEDLQNQQVVRYKNYQTTVINPFEKHQ
ncbi:PIN domain-containing protein [Gloeobacter morelensis]|uniref:PIN domain-containing protein n=1 Tax=Gloeobacter morelensis MG652769 TaxID=2781736 RepID=A0ABY3PNG9_9CYAN|nr:PIN domain-containing protein [Gloeobacter morelensis]UFP95114.1 PIN domain-containing protein [Gloeobacter morelensis MG652769]